MLIQKFEQYQFMITLMKKSLKLSCFFYMTSNKFAKVARIMSHLYIIFIYCERGYPRLQDYVSLEKSTCGGGFLSRHLHKKPKRKEKKSFICSIGKREALLHGLN